MLAALCLTSLAEASSLDRELLKRVLRKGDYRSCYEAALRTDGPFEGKASLRFEVDAGGKVTDVHVSFDRDLPSFTGCLRREGMKLRFPLGGPFQVTWPLIFKTPAATP